MNRNLFNNLIEKSFDLFEKGNNKFFHISYLADGNKVVAVGRNNMVKSHPFCNKYGYEYPFIHSELDAITKFPYRMRELKNYVMYNVRIGGDKKIRLSRPCIPCQRLIIGTKVKRAYFTNEYGLFERFMY